MKKILPLIFLILSFNSFSNTMSYESWVEEEIVSFNETEESTIKQASGAWDLDKVRLRVRPLFGVEIPFLASFEIKPFIEFHWQVSRP